MKLKTIKTMPVRVHVAGSGIIEVEGSIVRRLKVILLTMNKQNELVNMMNPKLANIPEKQANWNHLDLKLME